MPTKEIHELPDAALEGAVAVRLFGAAPDVVRPPYVSDTAAAWVVAEKLRELGWLVVVKMIPDGHPFLLDQDDPRARLHKRYTCSLTWIAGRAAAGDAHKYIFAHPWAFGETLGQAICRAALESLEWD
jgi:hypothetical protein